MSLHLHPEVTPCPHLDPLAVDESLTSNLCRCTSVGRGLLCHEETVKGACCQIRRHNAWTSQVCHRATKSSIMQIFCPGWTTGKVLAEWKEWIIILLYKGIHTVCSSYRTITLLSVLEQSSDMFYSSSSSLSLWNTVTWSYWAALLGNLRWILHLLSVFYLRSTVNLTGLWQQHT